MKEQINPELGVEGRNDGISVERWADIIPQIERGIQKFSSSNLSDVIQTLPLEKITNNFKSHPQFGRFCAAIVDLKLTYYFTSFDFNYACGVYNEQVHHKTHEGRDEDTRLGSRIVFLRSLNSYVLRARSYWDKYLGIWVLAFNPNAYEGFLDAKSRRTRFQTIMKDVLPKEMLDAIDNSIKTLDDKFRTAEAHATGTLRSWVLPEMPENLIATPFGLLVGLHNRIIEASRILFEVLQGEITFKPK